MRNVGTAKPLVSFIAAAPSAVLGEDSFLLRFVADRALFSSNAGAPDSDGWAVALCVPPPAVLVAPAAASVFDILLIEGDVLLTSLARGDLLSSSSSRDPFLSSADKRFVDSLFLVELEKGSATADAVGAAIGGLNLCRADLCTRKPKTRGT